MNSIILMCIFGIMTSYQAEGCNPYSNKSVVIKRANMTITHVHNYITQLKMNMTMELTQMKMDQTTRIYLIMMHIANDVMNELIGREHDRKTMYHCFETWYWTVYRTSISTTMKLNKCVKRNSEIFKPVRKGIREFLDARTHCLLNLDDVRTNICEDINTKLWNECTTAAALMNFTTKIPLTCEYDNYIIQLEDLKNKASALFTTGRDKASHCLRKYEGEYNDTMKPIIEVGKQCVSKILSEHE